MYEILDLISSAGQSYFTLDCLLDRDAAYANATISGECTAGNMEAVVDISTNTNNARPRVFFLTGLFMACLPLMSLAFTGIFWVCVFVRNKTYHKDGRGGGKTLYSYFLVSNVIVLFLLYPTLVKTAFRFFTCSREYIGDQEDLNTGQEVRFLESDFNIICWSDEHVYWASSLGVFMAGVYAFGIPATSFYILYTNFKTNSKYTKVFGFMYEGFRHEVYYWEVVIMVRKFFYGLCSELLRPYGVDIQTYAMCFVNVVAMLCQTEVKPYYHARMNFAEIFGLWTQFISLFLGLFQSSPNLEIGESSLTQLRFSVGIFIIVTNCLFLVFVVWQLKSLTVYLKTNKGAQTFASSFRHLTGVALKFDASDEANVQRSKRESKRVKKNKPSMQEVVISDEFGYPNPNLSGTKGRNMASAMPGYDIYKFDAKGDQA